MKKKNVLTLALLFNLVFVLVFPYQLVAARPLRQTLAATPASHTFASFNTGTITGGGAAISQALDISSLPSADYLFYNVTATYTSGGDAWSESMQMGLNNGGTTFYRTATSASTGQLSSSASTSLTWIGQMFRPYPGATSLTIFFQDVYATGSYTSHLQNVTVTIYPAPTPSHTFASFNTGTITGGGAAISQALDISSLPSADYLFYNVTATYTSGGDAWSESMQMGLNNGGTTFYRTATSASTGQLSSSASTSLTWIGQMFRPYPGATSLTIFFQDVYATGSYTSHLQNVTVTIYPAPTPSHTFASFNTGTITGGGAAISQALDISSLPSADYLFYNVTATYTSGGDAWSESMQMGLNNGGTTFYRTATSASTGQLSSSASTSLTWIGQMFRPYPGATSLTIFFQDVYATGSYTSHLQNVTVTIYPAVTAALIWVASNCTSVTKPCATSLAQAVNDVAIGGTLRIMDTLAAGNITISKDLMLESGAAGVINGSGGTAAVNITGGTVYVQNLTINKGSATNAIAVSSGNVTIRGNAIEGGGAAGIVNSGGTVSAYANNISNTGGAGIGGTISAPINWWGTAVEANRPTGVSVGDWVKRLGADIVGTAFGSGGTVTLGNAQLTGPGPGTGVIIDFGNGSANAPFGVAVSPYGSQTCSDFYDFYSTGGAGWTVVLPINTGTPGCTTNVLNAKKAYQIEAISECDLAPNTQCWDAIASAQITINGNNLSISGLSLSGTHITAGESSGGADPTAIGLQSLTVTRLKTFSFVGLFGFVGLSGIGIFLVIKSRRRSSG